MTTADQADDHIQFATRIIVGWERTGRHDLALDQQLQLVRDEIAVLDALAVEHPEMGGSIAVLALRYRRLQSVLKGMAN